jgi:choline-glycine betaine transporter
MMFVGGLDIIRSGVLVASLPMLAVSIAIVFALMKSLREHESM